MSDHHTRLRRIKHEPMYDNFVIKICNGILLCLALPIAIVALCILAIGVLAAIIGL